MLNSTIAYSTPPSSAQPALRTAPVTELRTSIACLRFTSVMFCVCLFAQRFGFPFSGQSVSVVGPAGLALGAWGLARGVLVLHRGRTALFLCMVGLTALDAAWHALGSNPFDAAPSTNSMLQFLGLAAFATLSFAVPVDEFACFARINRLLAIIACLGIAQFILQFAGLGLFSFTGILPDKMLIEQSYTLVIPVGIGELLKSNGLVLIEPSVFSQFMAIGLMIEVLTARRIVSLSLFAAGLLLSFSGTGLIVLASFFAFAGLRLGRRGVGVLLIAATVIMLAGGAAAVLAPDVADAFANRLGEISQPGTSGHMRFITPFWLVSDVLARAPSALLTGVGGGVVEKLTMPYLYSMNTPIKVLLEYGAPVLVAYLALFWRAERTALQGALFVPCMVLFLFAGGYQQFPPVLFPILLLVAVARLVPSRTRSGP